MATLLMEPTTLKPTAAGRELLKTKEQEQAVEEQGSMMKAALTTARYILLNVPVVDDVAVLPVGILDDLNKLLDETNAALDDLIVEFT